jgi:lysozyme family protein
MSIQAFNTAFAQTVGLEGKYSIDDKDPGNWTGGAVNSGQLNGTAWGISAAAYPNEDIAAIAGNPSKAKAIYLRDYWDKLQCDAFPDVIAVALFKEAVNLGVSGAIKALQRSLRITPDGALGQITLGIATSTAPKEVLQGFLTECAYEYTKMANFAIDGKGWLSRVIQTAVEAQLSQTEMVGANGVTA